MANIMKVQEVLAVFEKFNSEVRLGVYDYSPALLLQCGRTSTGLNQWEIDGRISYPAELITAPLKDFSIEVVLYAFGRKVFSEQYMPEYRQGFFSDGWVCPPEFALLLGYIKKSHKRLKDEEARLFSEKSEHERRQAEAAAERLRKLIQ